MMSVEWVQALRGLHAMANNDILASAKSNIQEEREGQGTDNDGEVGLEAADGSVESVGECVG